jgi:hypothetical protein
MISYRKNKCYVKPFLFAIKIRKAKASKEGKRQKKKKKENKKKQAKKKRKKKQKVGRKMEWKRGGRARRHITLACRV